MKNNNGIKNLAKQNSLRYSFFTLLYYRGTFGVLIYITWKSVFDDSMAVIYLSTFILDLKVVLLIYVISCYIFLQSLKFSWIFIGKKIVPLILLITFSSLWG